MSVEVRGSRFEVRERIPSSSALATRHSNRLLRPSPLLKGFTLVELVIALALIGLITLLLFAGLRLGTRAWEGVDATAERTGELRTAYNFLARALAQSRPATVTIDGEKHLVFAGDAQTLEFVAPLSEHVGIPGLYVLRLTLESGERDRLVLTRWLLHPDVLAGRDDVPEWEPFDGAKGMFRATGPLDEDLAEGAFGSILLLEAVEELSIAYFGVQEGQDEPDWYEDWFEQPRPPLALRLHVATPEQSWPDMLIPLPDIAE